MPEENYKTFVAHILRYTSDLVRDEWLNIGILLFDPETGERSSRLYAEHVELERGGSRVGAPGSRATMRSYCSQVWHQARLWERIEKSARVAEFTFPGDPMRIDYCYRRNGTRGFVQTLSVSRSP